MSVARVECNETRDLCRKATPPPGFALLIPGYGARIINRALSSATTVKPNRA